MLCIGARISTAAAGACIAEKLNAFAIGERASEREPVSTKVSLSTRYATDCKFKICSQVQHVKVCYIKFESSLMI
jgi:hypothetical protein